MKACHFQAQNSPFAPNDNFFRKTSNMISMYLLIHFIVQNFKKILRLDPNLWACTIFRPKMAHLPYVRFQKNHWYNFHVPLGYFHCAKLKKKYPLSQFKVMRMCYFWAQNGPFAQKGKFFRKPISKTGCNHSCLSTCKKSESDVYPWTRYGRLKKTKIWLAKSIFGHNLRTRFFPHMWFLQNAKGS